MPITFQVSEVAVEREQLPQMPVSEALGLRGLGEMEAHQATATSLIEGPALNGLLLATHLAFAHHLPLVIAPDEVWACLLQGFALHVAAAGESLRGRLVRHEGKQELRVLRNGFVRGADNDWGGVVHELVERMEAHLLVGTKGLVGGFSTTGPVEAVCSRVTLLSAMQSFFSYVVETLCGIPEITLLGTPEDWKALRLRAELLREFDLAWWVDPLLPALDEFVRAAEGHADAEKWQSFYKHHSTSGDEFVSGWILLLFPYVKHEAGGFTLRNPYVLDASGNAPAPPPPPVIEPRPGARTRVEVWGPPMPPPGEYEREEVSVSELPPGTATAPFVWEYLGTHLAMDLGAGLIGATQDPASGAVRAVHGWWVSSSASEILVVEPVDEASVQVRPRYPEKLRSLAGLREHAPRDRRVELVLDGCSQLASLAAPGSWRTVQRLTLRDAASLCSLDGVEHLRRVEDLRIDGAPLLRDLRALSSLLFLKRLEIARCPSLSDLRVLIHARNLKTIVLSGCDALPCELHGTFEGEAIPVFQARIREHQGRPRHRFEPLQASPRLPPALKRLPTSPAPSPRPPAAAGDGPARTHALVTLVRLLGAPYDPQSRGNKGDGYQFFRAVTLRTGSESLLLAGAAWPSVQGQYRGPKSDGSTTEIAPLWVVEVHTRPEECLAWPARLESLARAGVRYACRLDLAAETLATWQREGEAWQPGASWSGDVLARAEPFSLVEFPLFDLWCDRD
jgi:hypothetical protein